MGSNNHKEKIIFVSDAVWPYNKGGKEKRLHDISTKLANLGYDVHIFTMNWWKGSNTIVEEDVKLHALCNLYPLYSGNRRSIKEGFIFGISCLKLIGERWDVIDVDHMPFFPIIFTKLVCLLKRKKLTATWLEVWGHKYWVSYLGMLGYIAYAIEKFCIHLPNNIISISPLTTNKLLMELNATKNIFTLPIGIDLEYISTISKSLTQSDVVFVGRLLPNKNVNILIEAINHIKRTKPNIKLLIIGNGPEIDRLVTKSIELQLQNNVQFLTNIDDHTELLALIKASKVFVLPSTREGFGIVVLEANACGIPVLTINHTENAAKDLILEGKNGALCQLSDKEIANNILQILENSQNAETTNTIIKSTVNYDWKNIIEQLKEIYKI